MRNQTGFTLIELMVAIILGSVVSASAITLYMTSQKTYLLQEGFLSNQNDIDISFDALTDVVQKSGMNKPTAQTSIIPNGAIILSATNYGYSTTIHQKHISQSESGFSFVNKASDQLVVQYTPQVLGGYDCEGKKITSYDNVVERYFVRKSTRNADNLVLACASGRYASGSVTGVDDVGQTLIDGIDYFHTLLMVKNAAGELRNINFKDYALSATKYEVVGIQVGIIKHSNKPIGFKGIKNIDSGITVLDETVTFNSTVKNSAKKYVYEVLTQTISTRSSTGSIN